MPKKLISAGGQALIEGVLIRTQKYYAIAVRSPKGEIITTKHRIRSLVDKYPLFKKPILRGIVSLIEMITIGSKALTYSANVATGEEKEESWWQLAVSFLFAIVLAVLLFKYVPLMIATGLSKIFAAVAGSSILFSAIDGVAKIIIFVLYILSLSLSKEMRRVFQYHGAEHQAVHCYEERQALTPKNLGKYPTMHPRCGTSYILYVLLLSIFVYAFIPNTIPFVQKFGYRLLLLPFIAGVAYEVLKLAAKFQQNVLFKALSAPGICLQYITTQPSNIKQRAVAIAALKKAVR